MPITDDVRKYGETVLEQGKVALDEARKPWYAAVGAGDLAYGQLQQQLTQLPAEVQARIRKLQSGGRPLDAATLRTAVENAAEQAAGAYGTYSAQAKETYATLAHRGELVVRRLRRSPQVKETFGKAEELVSGAGQTVASAEDAVTKPGQPATRKPATQKPATPKPAAAKTTAAKPAPARKTAPAKRTPKN
jgi:heparin binding hemagglutinin HbhA